MTKDLLFALIAIALVVTLCAFPLIKNGYLGSADSMHTLMARILVQNGTQDTYAPYSNVSFTYPSQFYYAMIVPLLKLSPLPDYLTLAIIGVILVGIEFYLFYLITFMMFKNKRIALFALILLACSKFIYQDFYFGLFPRLAATCLLFLIFASYLTNSKCKWVLIFGLTIPMMFIHPAYSLLCLAFFIFYVLFYGKKEYFALFFLVLVGLMCALFSNETALFSKYPIGLNGSFDGIIPSLMGMGIVVLFFFVWAAIAGALTYRLTHFFFATCLGLFALSFLTHFSLNVALSFLTLTAIWFICEMWKHSCLTLGWLCLILLVGLSFNFLVGGYLPAIADGTKISNEGGQFAKAFYQFDPLPKKVLFLTLEGTKIAELSNKVPLDVSTGWFVPKGSLVKDNRDITKRQDEQQQIINSKVWLDDNFYNGRFDYVVIDATKYELPERISPFSFKQYKVFWGD